jgi:tRNA pseudouridine55 synthase
MPEPTPTGILLVDKPGGITSHDVVARARRALDTRKVGHAGTLDPMATGLLVLGVGAATRLLTYLVGLDKTYLATIRLGAATTTDDAEGEILERADAASLAAVADTAIRAGVENLTGEIEQVPSTVSAIKVDGRRAYDLARAGEEVALKSRRVTVSRFQLDAVRRGADGVDLDVEVDCSSGTYIRALARDLGHQLGVGGHLTALRRTRIGRFDVRDACRVDDIERRRLMTPADAAAAALPLLAVDAQQARDLRHGKRLPGLAASLPAPQTAAIDPVGALVGVIERRGDDVRSVMNMPEEQTS